MGIADGLVRLWDVASGDELLTIPAAPEATSDIGLTPFMDFSPDGKFISFTSDAGGGDNIWIVNRDGSDPKQVTKETFRLLNSPSWSPDSEFLVARKHFTSERSLGAGEMWLYHRSGGEGLQMTKKRTDQKELHSDTSGVATGRGFAGAPPSGTLSCS